MDRHHYKPINSGYWRLTSVWDMGNVGHDRVVCVHERVCWSVCGLQSKLLGNKLTGGPFSMIQNFQICDVDKYVNLDVVLK